ncbi:hypothetical protein Tco_0738824, partial [Tanacetum coccineum]
SGLVLGSGPVLWFFCSSLPSLSHLNPTQNPTLEENKATLAISWSLIGQSNKKIGWLGFKTESTSLLLLTKEAQLSHNKHKFKTPAKLLNDNSSPRPPKELNPKVSDAVIESFFPSPIPIEGSDSLMEEINLFLTPDDSIPPGIQNDDYDSEGDILFLEELLSNDSPSLPENESFHFDVPSSPHPPTKPLDDGIYFEPDKGLLIPKVVDDISDNSTRELYVHVPNVLPNLPTLSPLFDTLLPFSYKNDDKVFNHSILASNKEKSPHFLSHRGFKAFQVIYDFSEILMMIYGEDVPILDIPFLHFYPP